MSIVHWKEFKHKRGNRPIGDTEESRRNIAQKKVSILQWGYISDCPIRVNPSLEILDGQHRWAACVELDIAPTWVIVPDQSVEQIRAENMSTKKWTDSDYIYSAAEEDNLRAKAALHLMHEFNSSIACALTALGASAPAIKNMKDTPFTAAEIADARRLLTEIEMFSGLRSNSRVHADRKLLAAYRTVSRLPNFDMRRMRDRIERYGREMFVHCTTLKAQIANLVAIYNYGTHDNMRLPIPADTHSK